MLRFGGEREKVDALAMSMPKASLIMLCFAGLIVERKGEAALAIGITRPGPDASISLERVGDIANESVTRGSLQAFKV